MIHVLHALTAGEARTVIDPPGRGAGFWAGAPSAVADNGTTWLAYRLRRPIGQGRGYANVVARSTDGEHFETVAIVTSAQFDSASLERPALVRRPDGGWRLYVSCATHGSKHWWVEAVDADSPADLAHGRRTVVLPGDGTQAWKDVIVRAGNGTWEMWACRHPLDGGDDAADRMSCWYGTSPDGLRWTMHDEALRPVAGTWCARGVRMTDVVHADGRWWGLFDGRRSAGENWHERSGLATGDGPDRFVPIDGPVPTRTGSVLRYVTSVQRAGGTQLYFEAGRADGSHDLRTVYAPPLASESQSE